MRRETKNQRDEQKALRQKLATALRAKVVADGNISRTAKNIQTNGYVLRFILEDRMFCGKFGQQQRASTIAKIVKYAGVCSPATLDTVLPYCIAYGQDDSPSIRVGILKGLGQKEIKLTEENLDPITRQTVVKLLAQLRQNLDTLEEYINTHA